MKYIYVIAGFTIFLFPICYIWHKKGREKLLFVGASLGISTILSLPIYIPFFPAAAYLIKIARDLRELKTNDFFFNCIIKSSEFIEKNIEVIGFGLNLVLTLLITILIFRKYEIFKPIKSQ